MTCLPGETLDSWLQRKPVAPQEPEAKNRGQPFQRGCALAARLLAQVGPTLHKLSKMAYHRDVNSHNIMISDCQNGIPGRDGSTEDVANVTFGLIDFGLAVDAEAWVQK